MQSMKTTAPTLLLMLAACLTLTGCTVGPDYQAPTTPELSRPLAQPGADANTAPEVSPETVASWWTVLDDPALTDLVHKTLKQNRDFRAAVASVRQARARLGIATAGLLPQVGASGLYSRGRTSENIGMGPSTTSGYYNGQFDMTWEIDVFGGTRRSVQAAQADLQATSASLENVWVSLAGEVAEAYILLRTTQQQLDVTKSNLSVQQETLDLLQSRRKAGLVDDLAVLQATYNVERTKSLLPPLRANIEFTLSALAVLTGQVQGDLQKQLRQKETIPAPARQIAVGIPANALRRRPDIRQAERALAAQTARIGQATADLYPKFYLLGSVGLESLDSSDFFKSGSRAWSFGPSISWPIFRGGSIRQNIKAQTALQEQLLARYEQTVLVAVKEVQDALVNYAEQQNRRDSLKNAVGAAREAITVSQDQYKNGLVDFSNVLDSQRTLLELEEQLTLTEGQISTSVVRLYKALGGGWAALEDMQENQPAEKQAVENTDDKPAEEDTKNVADEKADTAESNDE